MYVHIDCIVSKVDTYKLANPFEGILRSYMNDVINAREAILTCITVENECYASYPGK